MPLVALFLLLLLAAPVTQAQTFPAPGTGVFSWERVGDRPLDTRSFVFAPDGRLYAGGDTLVVFTPPTSSAPAGRWQTLGYPPGFTDALFVLDPAGDTILVADGNGGQISRSTAGGATGTWFVVNGGIGGQIGGPNTPDGFFALPPGHPHTGRLLAGGGILHSDDRGTTWAEATRIAPFPGDGGYAHVFAALPSGRVLVAGNWGVAASDDGGASVATTPIWGDFRYEVNGVAALATPGSAQTGAPSCGMPEPSLCDGAVAVGIDATGPSVRAWWTNDGGRSWSDPVLLPEPEDGVGSGLTAGVVAVSPGADGLGPAITIGGRGIVRRTVDGGQTWEIIGRMPIRLGGGSHFTRLLRLGPDGHLWVSTTINGTEREWMYRSREPAETAFPVAGEPAPASRPRLGVSVRPNPAGGVAEITWSPGARGPVVVTVVDALGREVLRATAMASGDGPLVVDTASWPVGVYTVRAVSGTDVATTRLTVVR